MSAGGHEHQNWDVVTLNQRRQKPTHGNLETKTSVFAAAQSQKRPTHSKQANKQRKEPDNAKQIRDADEAQKVEKISHCIAQAIMQTRNIKWWTQKELATKINEPQSLIRDYEAGRAVPNNQILGKLERVLG